MRGDVVKPRIRGERVHGGKSPGDPQGRAISQAVICVTSMGSHYGRFWVPLELGSYMPYSSKRIFLLGLLGAAALGTAACAPRKIPSLTVEDLMEDRVMLDGVLLKCDKDPVRARNNSDCLNARIAIERLAKTHEDPTVEQKRKAEFERSREQLRLAQEKMRQEQEAKTKVDAYSLPVVPVDAPPKGDAPTSTGTPTQ